MEAFTKAVHVIRNFLHISEDGASNVIDVEAEGYVYIRQKEIHKANLTKLERSILTIQNASDSAKEHLSSFFSGIKNLLKNIFSSNEQIENHSSRINTHINSATPTPQSNASTTSKDTDSASLILAGKREVLPERKELETVPANDGASIPVPNNATVITPANSLETALEGLRNNTVINIILSDDMSTTGAGELAKALKTNTSLKSLNLYGHLIGAYGVREIAEALKSNTTLTTLVFEDGDIGTDGAKALAEVLKTNSSLTSLGLGPGQDRIKTRDAIGNAGAQEFAEALKFNTTLTSLRLFNQNIGSDGAKALSEMLKTNISLTSLELTANSIGADGTKAVAEALKTNAYLTELSLAGNEIGHEGVKALAEALSKNTKLTGLNLVHNNLGANAIKVLAEGLHDNRSLIDCDISGNRTDKSSIASSKELEKILVRNKNKEFLVNE